MVQIVDGQPTMRKFWLKPLCAILILAVMGVGGYYGYRHWQLTRVISKARAALDAKDYNAASLNIRRAFELDPKRLETTRLAAELLDVTGSTDAVQWRRKVVDMAPTSAPDKIALATTAIRFNDMPLAEKTLAGLQPGEKQGADFELCEGNLAYAKGDFNEAAAHFGEAVKFQQGNSKYRFNQAMALLKSPDMVPRNQGLTLMATLVSDRDFALLASRALVQAHLQQRELEEALAENESLLGRPGAEFSDRLTSLDIMARLGKPEAGAALQKLEADAAKNEHDAGALISWISSKRGVIPAVEFANTLPKPFLQGPECGIPLAACYLAQRDWNALLELTGGAKWGGYEFVRFAYLARSQRETGANVYGTWESAIAAAGSLQTLRELERLVTGWGPDWKQQSDQTLTELWEKWSDPMARLYLFRKYVKEGNTYRLRDIATELMKADPSNQKIANNYAMFSLLLNLDVPGDAKIAKDLYEAEPANSAYASTYAYALLLIGKPELGLKVMENLGEVQFSDPAVAAYYGILLEANNKPEKAIAYLELADQKGSLLPEERTLVKTALTEAKARQSGQISN